ncbi:DUF2663 family protein [Fictibacillus sp. Mic-4]|uniref:DUF2663 family protein n=1 Tax=Fictibacillus TaxID=1329200 RepID=UPI000427FC2A|nr:DUF2663 family protein [Fictibacillus gelatini]
MNASNWKIDPYMTEVSKVVLKNLVRKKEEKDRFERLAQKWSFAMFLVGLGTFLYLFLVIWPKVLVQHVNLVYMLMSDKVIMGAIFLYGLSLFQFSFYKKKHKKADEEFELVRNDVIERGDELWSEPEQWKNRHHILAFMKSEYNINIYHK